MQPNLTPDSAPIVVDRVEWVPGSPEAVEVRVYGRWRDRPPEGPLALVVEHRGRVHRFDPVAGAPGAILSFAVPNELRARLAEAGALALTVGSDRLALAPAVPGSIVPEPENAPSGTVVDRAVLAERRARRAELAEESLARRATEAEGTVSTLEAQLANLEERLAQAAAERDELESTVAERERSLRAAEQREYAEQQRRVEAEDELSAARRAAETELGELRERLRDAGERADELARELSRARRAVAQAQEAARHERRERERLETGVRERADALAVADEDLEAEVVALRGRADELARDLAAERAARGEVEALLADEVDQAQAQVSLLEREVDRRASVQEAVQHDLAAVRDELERVRTRTEDDAARRAQVESALGEAARATAALREQVADLEHRRTVAETTLTETRHALRERAEELARARIDAERAQRRLDEALAADARRAAEVEEAELTLVALRQTAVELQGRLDEERRARAGSETALRTDLLREREAFQRQIVEAEVELRAQIGSQRQAFADQVAAIERTVAELRGQLGTAAGTLRERLDAERAGREAAEAELASERARLEEERLRIEGERRRAQEELAAEHAAAEADRAAAAEARAAVDALRADLENARDDSRSKAQRIAHVEALVGEIVGVAATLREGYEREAAALEGQIAERVGAERERFARELAAMEAQVDRVREQIAVATTELRTQLEAERAARWAAEAELALEREGGARADLEAELAVRREAEARALADLEIVRVELAAVRAELDRALAGAEARAARQSESERVIGDLQTAAQRLRAQAPPLEEEDDAEPPAAPAEESGDAAPVEESGQAAPVAEAEPPAPAAPAPQILAPRVVPPSAGRPRPWLAPAIAAFAAQDPQAAGRLVVALLPVQRAILRQPVVYALTIQEVGGFLVRARPGEVVVVPGSVPVGTSDIAFHLAGPAATLAQLAGGGARRRLRGTQASGSRRQLRRMLRQLRTPIGLSEALQAGVLLDPGQVLGVLGAGMDSAWTAGHGFSVVWDVRGPQGGTWTVRVAGGLPVTVIEGVPDQEPTATVHVSHGTLLSLLAGEPVPPGDQATVDGDADAVALLRDWAHRVQGLAG